MALFNLSSQLNQYSDCANNSSEENTISSLNEICQFNRVIFKFNLIEETFVDRCKYFVVSVKLSNGEEYTGKGSSIRKAEREAALNALKHTKLKPKPKLNHGLTPTVALNGLAMKLGQKVEYEIIESDNIEHHCFVNNLSTQSEFDFNQCTNNEHKPFPIPQFRACVKLGDVHYHGKGQTAQLAKHSAAEAALKALNSKSERNADHDILTGLNKPSSVSALYELAAKRNFKVRYELVSESGLCHIPTFITKCLVDDNVTEGKGNSKKLAKQEAAQKMLQLLKPNKDMSSKKLTLMQKSKEDEKQQPLMCCMLMTSQEGTSRDTKSYSSDKEDTSEKVKLILAKNEMNPITRLIQLQSARKEPMPKFTLVSFKLLNLNASEFVMECVIPYPKVGSDYNQGRMIKTTERGHNKKTAKANAAEAMLKLLNNFLTNTNQDKEESANDNKAGGLLLDEEGLMKTKSTTDTGRKKNIHPKVAAGHPNAVTHNTLVNQFRQKPPNEKSTEGQNSKLNLKSEQEIRSFASIIAKESLQDGISSTALKLLDLKISNMSWAQKRNAKASQQLNMLANALSPNVHVNYQDTPSSNESQCMSVVNVSFNIYKSFAGIGGNFESSRESAALLALKSLAAPVTQTVNLSSGPSNPSS